MEYRPQRATSSADAGPGTAAGIDWPALFSRETATEALAVLARGLGPPLLEARVAESDRGHGVVAEWRRSDSCTVVRRIVRAVEGRPEWRLTLALAFEPLETASYDAAACALAAWRQHRADLDREALSMRARTREVELIQSLAQRCSEARDPAGLFRAAVEVLDRAELADTVVVAHALAGGEAAVAIHGADAGSGGTHAEWERRARSVLGWEPSRPIRVEGVGACGAVDEGAIVVLPILRRDRVVAALWLVPGAMTDDRDLHLAYGVGNQLALHLDRILTVQEAESDRTRDLLSSLPQAIVVVDARRRIVLANPAADALLERLGADADADADGDASSLIERLGIGDAIARVERGDAGVVEDEVYDEPDRAISVSVFRVPSPTGPQVALLLADVSERRRSQQRLSHAEKMTSLGQMISGVAHELNNPLSSVLGYAQLLARGEDVDATARRRLDTLEREAQRCQRIVQNLLSFARRRGAERQPVSLNEVVESVLGLLGYQLRVSGVTVERDTRPDLPAIVADRHELQQVLVNLLTNARHALEGVDDATIRLTTDLADDGSPRLVVSDNGPGIPPARRRKIFEPFFTTKPEGVGTGLGLSLSYDIVRAHGGRIEVGESGSGGAAFALTFPPTHGRAPGREEPTPVAAATGPVRAAGVSGARILVVDDEPAVAGMIREALAEDGHTIHAVADADAALERLRAERFDLVVTDLRMPGRDGRGLVDALRASPRLAALPVLVTTGDTLRDDPGVGPQRDVVQKPFDVDLLRRAVAERLRRD